MRTLRNVEEHIVDSLRLWASTSCVRDVTSAFCFHCCRCWRHRAETGSQVCYRVRHWLKCIWNNHKKLNTADLLSEIDNSFSYTTIKAATHPNLSGHTLPSKFMLQMDPKIFEFGSVANFIIIVCAPHWYKNWWLYLRVCSSRCSCRQHTAAGSCSGQPLKQTTVDERLKRQRERCSCPNLSSWSRQVQYP